MESPSDSTIDSQSTTSKITKMKAGISVFLLCFINLINYMDRYTLAGVLIEVKSFYGLNDTTAGLLQTAFVVSYMMMAPVFGYLGDRYSRKKIIICGISFWSLTTLLGSFMPHDCFLGFLAMRALVGVGEASYSTIAPTIIADLFHERIRTNMLAIFYFAIPVGSGMGYIVGSQVSKLFDNEWFWALRVTPILGLIAIILSVFFLDDPKRGGAEGAVHISNTPIKQDLSALLKTRSFVWSSVGFTCVAFTVGALSWWAPSYMIAAKKISEAPDEQFINLIFGVITCLAGIVGILLGSGLSKKLRPIYGNADPLICACGVVLSIPFMFLGVTFAAEWPYGSWICIFFAITCLCVNWAIIADILLYVVIPTRRSLAEAIQILFSHALGDASSPYIVGMISDAIKPETATSLSTFLSMQKALYLPLFVLLLGAAAFLMCSFYIEQDKKRCTLVVQGTSINSVESNGSLHRFDSDVDLLS